MGLTPGEYRDLVLFGLLGILLVVMVLRKPMQVPHVPPMVSPMQQPVEDQVRDVRHRIAGAEQRLQIVDDHAVRLRTMEREVGEVRSVLGSITQGQERMERHLDMLVQHHLSGEDRK